MQNDGMFAGLVAATLILSAAVFVLFGLADQEALQKCKHSHSADVCLYTMR
jgi:hypothetical protein